MYRDTLAQIKAISNIFADPARAERAMHARLKSCVKLCKKVLTRDLLNVLHKYKIGTNDVSRCVKVLCIDSRNAKRKQKLICYLMKDKLEDAEKEVKRARNENLMKIKEYKKEIKEGERADMLFKDILKREREKVWSIGKTKKNRKVNYLLRKKENKRTRNTNDETNEDVKGIKYRDEDMEKMSRERDGETYINKPRIYGGVQVDSKTTAFLSKDPGFMMYDRLDALNIEVEIEKGITKTRYELMNRGEEDEEEEECNQGMETTQQDEPNKILNYSNLRATEIPTVPRLIEPEKGTLKQEIVMETTKQKLLNTLHTYMATNCDKKGEIKESNLEPQEKKQLKEIK